MSITRKNNGVSREVRPTFTYEGPLTWDSCKLQMLEDVRNVLEQIREKQMLQCDVRGDIAALRAESRRMRIALERIANNFPAKRGRPKTRAK